MDWMAGIRFQAVKGKVVPVLTEHHAMKAYWGVKVYSSTHSLTSALDAGEWSASRPGRFPPRKRVPGTYWIGGWVGPRAYMDAVVKRIIPSPRRESILRTPIIHPVTQRYTDRNVTAVIRGSVRDFFPRAPYPVGTGGKASGA
jgi:hypothetical protein